MASSRRVLSGFGSATVRSGAFESLRELRVFADQPLFDGHRAEVDEMLHIGPEVLRAPLELLLDEALDGGGIGGAVQARLGLAFEAREELEVLLALAVRLSRSFWSEYDRRRTCNSATVASRSREARPPWCRPSGPATLEDAELLFRRGRSCATRPPAGRRRPSPGPPARPSIRRDSRRSISRSLARRCSASVIRLSAAPRSFCSSSFRWVSSRSWAFSQVEVELGDQRSSTRSSSAGLGPRLDIRQGLGQRVAEARLESARPTA